MKMHEVFELPVTDEVGEPWFGHAGTETSDADFRRAAAHAVNCHDDLLAALEAREKAKVEARAATDAFPNGEVIPARFMNSIEKLFAKADALEAAALAKARGEG